MSNEKFHHVGSISIRLIEECAELQKEICKAERFGLFHHWPDYHKPGETNADNILREITDVERCIAEMKEQIRAWQRMQEIFINK